MKGVPLLTLDELIDNGVIELGRGKIISKKDIAACPGPYPIYSSAKENDGKFGEYGIFMFDEELITWSVDGGGRLFHRAKHKFSVTNVGGTLRILDTTVLDYRYLYYALTIRHAEIAFDWVLKAHPSTIRKLYKDIPVPPLPEQHRIVAILDEAFDGIATAKANAEKNLQNARALFESYLQAVFTERGEGWVEIELADVCERLHQGLNTAGEKVKFYDEGYPIIQTRNIDDGFVELDQKIKFMCEEDWLRYRDKFRPEVGDVFFTNIGTIGKTAIVTEDRDYLIHWNIFKLRPLLEQVTSEFLRYTLEFLTASGYFKKLQKGGTVDFVTKKMISEALIYLPNIAEQKQFVATLDALREETQRLESIYQQKLTALDDLKKSLLHQAFSGAL